MTDGLVLRGRFAVHAAELSRSETTASPQFREEPISVVPDTCLPPHIGSGINAVMSLMKLTASTATLTLAVAAITLTIAPATTQASPEVWTEVKSPHFVVYTNASPKEGARTADQFEQMRAVFLKLTGKSQAEPYQAILILAVKNEASLRELLPGFYEVKGRTHPAGIFQPGAERNYVAFRLDAPAESSGEILYHEYTHFLLRLMYGDLPVWLNEGLAEFYGHTKIGDKEVIVGQPSSYHVALLRDAKLMPVETLFAAGHDSPLYNEQNKASVFYAESWAIVHYEMLGSRTTHGQQLSNYIRLLLNEHVDQVEAARRSFGDLAAFTRTIEAYARNQAFYQVTLPPTSPLDKSSYPTRALTEAESLAVRGNFLAYSRRPNEARPLLSQAATLDPRLADPHEGLGLLALAAGNYDEAEREFSRAAQLDSHSALAYLLSAQAILRHQSGNIAAMKDAEAGLRKALTIDPNLAEAHGQLAMVLLANRANLEEALTHTLRAAALQPDRPEYKENAVQICIALERYADAEKIGTQLLARASTPAQKASANSLLDSVHRAAEWRSGAAPTTHPQTAEDAKPNAAPVSGAEQPVGGPVKFEGKITESNCDGRILYLNLEGHLGTLRLRAPDFLNVEYLAYKWEPPSNFSPCEDLKGHTVRATYRKLPGELPRGEVSTIEVLQ